MGSYHWQLHVVFFLNLDILTKFLVELLPHSSVAGYAWPLLTLYWPRCYCRPRLEHPHSLSSCNREQMECDWLNNTKVVQEKKDQYPLVGLLLYFPLVLLIIDCTVKIIGIYSVSILVDFLPPSTCPWICILNKLWKFNRVFINEN